MAFTYDLSTDAGKVRLKIGDTDAAAYVFEDDEISYFLTAGGSVDGGAIEALRALLTSRSYRMKRATVQGVAYDDTAQVAAIKEALALLGGDMPTVELTTSGPMPWEQRHFTEGGL